MLNKNILNNINNYEDALISIQKISILLNENHIELDIDSAIQLFYTYHNLFTVFDLLYTKYGKDID